MPAVGRMRRREFLGVLGGAAAAAWPLAARAQQPGKRPTIGLLIAGTPSSHGRWVNALVQRLRELGWIEGSSIAIEYRWAEGRTQRYTEIAAEFVRLKVDVIVTSARTARMHFIFVLTPRRLRSKCRRRCSSAPTR